MHRHKTSQLLLMLQLDSQLATYQHLSQLNQLSQRQFGVNFKQSPSLDLQALLMVSWVAKHRQLNLQ